MSQPLGNTRLKRVRRHRLNKTVNQYLSQCTQHSLPDEKRSKIKGKYIFLRKIYYAKEGQIAQLVLKSRKSIIFTTRSLFYKVENAGM